MNTIHFIYNVNVIIQGLSEEMHVFQNNGMPKVIAVKKKCLYQHTQKNVQFFSS